MASLKISPFWMWVVALLVALSGLVFQRLTAPFYPVLVESEWNGATLSTQLESVQSGPRPARFVIKGVREHWQGEIIWRGLETGGGYRHEPMTNLGSMMVGELPLQLRGTRIEYRLRVHDGAKTLSLPNFGTMIMRFRGDLPIWAILGHLIAIHLGLLFAVRAAMEVLALGPNGPRYSLLALGLYAIGGLFFGAIVKASAYGMAWNGLPIGLDLTDSKTLIVTLAWCLPPILRRRGRRVRGWILVAALLSIAAFFIPHTVLGGR